MLRKMLLLIAAVSLAVGFASHSMAAIIGPKDDWIPIEYATKPCPPKAAVDEPNLACGLSQEQVDAIMAAGVGFTCPGTDHGNPIALNGWFLGDAATDTQYIYTNMHGIFDQDGRRREPLGKCYVYSYSNSKDQSRIDDKVIFVGSDMGYLDHHEDQQTNDRAKIKLARIVKAAQALAVDPTVADEVEVGDRVFMVSLNPEQMTQALIQACSIIKIAPKLDVPTVMQTDCDNAAGTSAALFMADPDAHDGTVGSLRPIALHAKGNEVYGDNADAEVDWNSTVDIALDSRFFEFVPFERN